MFIHKIQLRSLYLCHNYPVNLPVMNKIKIILVSILFSILVTGCQTVQQKTDAIVKKENEKLSKFIGKSSSELQIQLGKPDEDFKNAEGNLELIYNTKKYLIPCERRFEINSENVVIGFVSNGCF
tara:strand:- start:101 stop:475 length:375 start_codon:yes stop_codon:yes gene_type:complete